MAPAAPWADLHRELLESVAAADGLSLRDYTCLRGVCTAWRSALETPSYPCLLALANDKGRHHSASVYSLPMRRSFHLHTASSALDDSRDRALCVHLRAPVVGRARVVGSSNGRFAVAVDQECTYSLSAAFLSCRTSRIFVLDPRSGKEVELAAPATSIGPCYDHPGYEYVSKVVFAPAPYDRKNVAYVDITRSRKKWTTIDVVTRSGEFLDDLAFGEYGKLYCVASNGAVHVLRIPGGDGGHTGENSPVVEPLPTLVYNPEPAASAFVPPYNIASTLSTTKNLFFCHGSLYQVWRNNSATVTSGGYRMSAGEILVLRYDPGRWPCWDRVNDLGGCSVFIGKSCQEYATYIPLRAKGTIYSTGTGQICRKPPNIWGNTIYIYIHLTPPSNS
uniref:Uncharacterized protein n=1 Tax=Avena sativa TaxID=4498 RepID=A0ACD5YAM5_AVESA